MSRVLEIDGVDLSDVVEVGGISELRTVANGGERGGGTITVTDHSGTLDLKGWHSVVLYETACVPRPRLFTGRLGGKEIKRGAEAPIGAGRVWECELEDVNVLAKLRTFEVAGANRPAEKADERIAWALSTAAVGGSFSDTGFVNAVDPVDFDAADYRDVYPDTTFDDVSQPIGYDWFLFWDDEADTVGTFYDRRDSAVRTSSLKISNVAGDPDDPTDLDAIVFAPSHSTESEDAVVNRDHSEVYDRVTVVYANGRIIETRPATTAVFFPDAPNGRSFVITNTRIGREATARSHALQFLEAHSIEYDTVTIPVHMPATHVNLIREGERVQVRLEHEPGYEADYVWLRVAVKTISEAGLGEDNLDWYDVKLELTNAPPTGIGGGHGAPPPGDFPYPPQDGTPGQEHFYSGSLTMPTESTGIASSSRVGGSFPVLAGDGTTSSTNLDLITLVAGVTYQYSVDYAVDPLDAPVGTKSFGLATSGLLYSWQINDAESPPTSTVHWEGSFTPLATASGLSFTAYQPGFSHGIRPITVTWVIDPYGWVPIPPTGPPPPLPGQEVPPEIVTMDGPRGRVAAGAFAEGSLRVWVDILEQTAGLLYVDGECGDFTLGFTPKTGEVVTVTYKGR